jgi:hypothetical protein
MHGKLVSRVFRQFTFEQPGLYGYVLIAISVRVKKLYSLFQCECFTVGVLFLVRSISILHGYIQTL